MSRDGEGPVDRAGAREADSQPTVVERRPAPATTPARPSARADVVPPARSVFDPPDERFVGVAELGRGGMGRVVEARDVALDRPVAIKHLLASSPELVARFEREVRITARLQHPGIVPILDAGRDEHGLPYYVMRKIDGAPLSERVGKHPVRERLALIPAVLGAVDAAAYAHAQGVVHRDIKPWNILLGPFGETLLIDWGIARTLDDDGDVDPDVPDAIVRPPTAGASPPPSSSHPPSRPSEDQLTQLGVAVGTPGFMAPEQARGEPVDRRADVYSLGATLYFVLTGALPFGTSGATEAITEVAAGRGPDLTLIPPEVPAELTAITSQALAADPRDRYADAGELAADLRRFLAGKLVAAHEYTTRERIARWVRRHRLAVAITSAAAVAIGVVVAVAFDRVVDERDHARTSRALAEARSEEMLIDRARALVDSDPTSAVALLRGLPRSSTRWPAARALARAAVVSGVDRGVVAHEGWATAVALSPGGRVMTSGHDGRLVVHDRELRTRRTVTTLDVSTYALRWLDEHHVVISSSNNSTRDDHTIRSVNVETGAVEVIATGVRDVEVVAGRIALIYGDRRVEFRPSVPTLPAWFDSATTFARNGSMLAALGAAGIVVILPDGSVRSLRFQGTAQPQMAAVSSDGKRVAALVGSEIIEWVVGGTPPMRRWSAPSVLWPLLFYAEGTLCASINERRQLVSLATDTPVTRWVTREVMRPPSLLGDGAIIATEEGAMAYLDAGGLIELPRRRVGLQAITGAPHDRRAYAVTTQGELLEIDLGAALPAVIPGRPGARPIAVSSARVLLADNLRPVASFVATKRVSTLELIDLNSEARQELPSMSQPMAAMTSDSTLVFSRDTQQVSVFDLDGTRRAEFHAPFQHNLIGPSIEGDGRSLFYVLPTGELFELRLEGGGPPRLVHRFTPRQTASGAPMSFITGMSATRWGLIASEGWPGFKHMTYWLIDRHGARVFGIGELPVMSWGRQRDGTYWLVDVRGRLQRKPVGAPAVDVPIDNVTAVRIIGDAVWASTNRQVFELAHDGTIVRALMIPGDKRTWSWLTHLDEMLVSTPEGLELIDAALRVRRRLRSTRSIVHRTASHDGRALAVLRGNEEDEEVAVWRDPVPEDPAAVPAYLDGLTNARLSLGSDSLQWD